MIGAGYYFVNLEVALLALLAVGFGYLHFRGGSIPSGFLSVMFSGGTVLVWLGGRSPVPSMAWLFAIFGVVILVSTGKSIIEWWGETREAW